MIVAAGLRYQYPGTKQPVLQDLNFSIAAGELILLAGASGSGKSTLCRLFSGLIPHLHGGDISGILSIAGNSPHLIPPAQMTPTVGLLLQRPDAQSLATTVARDIALGPACQGQNRSTIARRVREIAEQLHVTHLLQRAPHTLSGGEQQRVALASVLAMRPEVLVLDEPLAFLDTAGISQLRDLLKRLRAEGVTLIVAEHRLEEIASIANRLLVLHQGRLVADGSPATVLADNIAAWGLEPPGSCIIPPTLAHTHGKPVIEWDDIWYERLGRPVLCGATLSSSSSDITVIVGANGAGKSTLLRHGNGLLRSQRGSVRVLGQAIAQRPVAEVARTVGLVIQQPIRMLFAPTVRDELAAGPRALNRHDPAWQAELIERLQLASMLDRPPQLLSAGEQRRVAIAAVLTGRPQALLLDEPTAGQDAHARAALRTLLHEFAVQGLAITLATHHLQWAYSLSQRWAVLTNGRITTPVDPTTILAQPELLHPATSVTPLVAA